MDRNQAAPATGLRLSIVDRDEDYLGLEIRAASARFAGSTRVYAGTDDLSGLASRVEGFPSHPEDERRFELGSMDPRRAGGFAALHFRCVDLVGHAEVEVVLEDDEGWYSAASARFTFPVHAADVDRFVERLRDADRERSDEVVLPEAGPTGAAAT